MHTRSPKHTNRLKSILAVVCSLTSCCQVTVIVLLSRDNRSTHDCRCVWGLAANLGVQRNPETKDIDINNELCTVALPVIKLRHVSISMLFIIFLITSHT